MTAIIIAKQESGITLAIVNAYKRRVVIEGVIGNAKSYHVWEKRN